MRFFCFFIFFSSSLVILMSCGDEDLYISKEARVVHDILEKSADAIETKHNLALCGEGAAMPGGVIKVLMIDFRSRSHLSKEELRKLLIESAQEIVNQAEKNEKIEEYLEKPPFELKNVQIIIHNYGKQGEDLYDPDISTAQISKNILDYATFSPEDPYQYKNEYEETYEEALAILQSQ